MDTLALLCNLHADGPATLVRLRREGCETLAALRRLEPQRLASVLQWNERAAERFLREATLLALRTEGPELESEAESEGEFELESLTVAELDGAPVELESEGLQEEEDLEELEEAAPATVAEEGVEALLGAWRELDRVAPPVDPGLLIPRPPAATSDRRLDGLALEGLSPELLARLVGKGVRTLLELCEADALELARALGFGYTRLLRLQAEARRHLASMPAAATPPVSASRFESYTPPPAEPFETAGPFA